MRQQNQNTQQREAFYCEESKFQPGDLDLLLLADWDLDRTHLQESLTFKLLDIARRNQLHALQKGIRAHVPLKVSSPVGHTPLTIATQFGAKDVTQFLLDHGLNAAFFVEDYLHYNAFFFACAGGQYEMIRMLLNHPSKKVSIDMAEPRNHQSGLQVAVHNLQFELAKKLITEHPSLLLHTDKLKRTVGGTLLSIFVTNIFTDHVENTHREPELDAFCLFLLKNENPFHKVSVTAIPAMQVIINSALATFTPSNKSMRMTALDAVRTLHLATPQFAKALMELAERNPRGMLEHHFLTHSKKHLADMARLQKHQ